MTAVLSHLAEAGAHSNRHDQVAARILELEPVGAAGASSLLRVHLHCAKALLARGKDAWEVLEKAPEDGLTEWSFERARFQLAQGTLLRRDRASAARPVLRAAGTLDALAHAPGPTARTPSYAPPARRAAAGPVRSTSSPRKSCRWPAWSRRG